MSAARPPLWRDSDYRKIWSARSVSQLGSQVSLIAIPVVAVIVLSASALEVALLSAVEMLPFLVLALPAGAWLDRVRRRPVLVAADLGRGLALLTVPVAFAGGELTMGQLYAVAVVTGCLTVAFDVADQAYLPCLVGGDRLVEANSALGIGGAVAEVAGPGLGGSLVGLVGAPFAVAADALSFLVSAALVWRIRRREPMPAGARSGTPVGAPGGVRPGIRAEIADGLSFVLGNRSLRGIALCTGASNLFASALFSVFPVLVFRDLGLTPFLFGSVTGVAGLGLLCGAGLSGRLIARVGLGPAIVGAACLSGPAFLAMAAAPAGAAAAVCFLFCGQFAAGIARAIYNVGQISLRQATTPLELQGRMNATMRFLAWGTIPIGALFGGALASTVGVRPAVLVAASLSWTPFLFVLCSPVRLVRDATVGTARTGSGTRPSDASPERAGDLAALVPVTAAETGLR